MQQEQFENYSEWPSENFDERFDYVQRDYSAIGYFAIGMLFGAGAMFLLDPRGGGRRRALIRDKVVRGSRRAREYADKHARDIANRARGAMEEVKARRRDTEGVPDETIAERVRAQLGHVVSHPGSLEITVNNGVVTLRGPVLSGEIQKIRDRLDETRGVHDYRIELTEHERPESISGLQGVSRDQRERMA
jgi:osmotically-inducible protein OsmY